VDAACCKQNVSTSRVISLRASYVHAEAVHMDFYIRPHPPLGLAHSATWYSCHSDPSENEENYETDDSPYHEGLSDYL